jgi:hypothetical protein
LLAGARPDAVFATLAEDTHDYRGAALAVCTAAGIPRAQAQQRWIADGAELVPQVQPGDAAELGFFLELAGFFDVHRQLDEREQHIRHLLDQAVDRAFATLGGLPSGYAHGLSRKLRTGRLAEAFVSMATFGARQRHPMPAAYWTHLLAAADLLAISDDDQFESCVVACRQRLEQRP